MKEENDDITLLRELSGNATKTKTHAKNNYKWAYRLTLIGAASSTVVTLIVALGKSSDWQTITSIIAALPAAAMLLESRLRLEERSRWLWNKTKQLEALSRSLKFEGANEVDVSRMWSQLEVELEEHWVGLGRHKEEES